MSAGPIIAKEDELARVCDFLYQTLQDEPRYVLWLEGPMGAGKTTLIRHFLRSLGLDPRVPVVSPTYTLMNEYQIKSDWYAHLDFYRAGEDFSFAELGLDSKDYKGVFIEWPDAPAEAVAWPPTHRLFITPISETERRYELVCP